MPGPPRELRALQWLRWQAEAAHYVLTADPGCAAWAGGKGSGKSVLVGALACLLAMTRPGAEILLGMSTYPMLRDIHVPIFVPLARSCGADWNIADREARFPNGSVVRLRHLEVAGDPALGSSPIEGQNLHAVIADECQDIDPRYWTVLHERARVPVVDATGRLRPPVVITSGLPVSSWWCARTTQAGGRVWRPRTRDNLHNSADYEARLRASMTEERARAMLDGEELQPEGVVYRQFRPVDVSEGGSLIDWDPAPGECRYWLSGDLGYRWPAFVLWAEHVERAAWVAVDEWAPDNVDIAGISRDMLTRTCPRQVWRQGDPRRPVDLLITDPAGGARSAQTGQSDLDIWALKPPEGYGMRPRVETRPERRGVVEGIHRVQLALERRQLLVSANLYARGMSGDARARTLARSLLAYAWDPKRPQEPLKDGVNDHHVDGVRYLVRESPLWNLGDAAAAWGRAQLEAPTRKPLGGKGGW